VKKIVAITFLLGLFGCFSSMGQGYYWQSAPKKSLFDKTTLDGGLGVMAFYGDMQTGSKTNPLSFNYNLAAIKHLSPRWSLAGQVTALKYSGRRQFGDGSGIEQTMVGKFVEGTVNINYNIIKFVDFGKRSFTRPDPISKFNVYVFLGVGAAMFSANVTGTGENASFTLPRSEKRKIAMLIPVGFGAKHRVNKHWSFGIEIGYKNYLTDDLDATNKSGTAKDKLGLTLLRCGYTF